MGKIEYFSIVLEKPHPIYFSGETVSGKINLKVIERIKINSVKMTIFGVGRVHWSETHGSGKNRTTHHYSAKEEYLNATVIFTQKPPHDDLYLEIGTYSYPFQILLPINLPTSFEHSIGRVRYYIKGTIDIPWAFDKYSTKHFSVVNMYDLNSNPALRQPIGLSGNKVLCCGPCQSDPIIAQFSVMKAGYVPGERINFDVKIDNRSNREVKSVSVSLIQQIKFHSTKKSKTERRQVASIYFPKVINKRSFEEWKNSVLSIPSVCPNSNGCSKIIELNYTVLFSFECSGPSLNMDMNIPIVIGTVPLRDNLEAPHTLEPPPYSYEESAFDLNSNRVPNDDINNGELVESDFVSYRPQYPFYKDYVFLS